MCNFIQRRLFVIFISKYHLFSFLLTISLIFKLLNWAKNSRITFVLEELAFSPKEYALPTMRNTLRECLKLSRPLHSVSVVAKQAPLALSNAKVSCKHGLWLVARVNNIKWMLNCLFNTHFQYSWSTLHIFYLFNLNELFKDTMRLNTRASGLESLLSMQKKPLRTNW